jgi:large subunit ribosomal protein L17
MHQQSKNRKLGREYGQRKALLKSLMRSLILQGKIETTEAKAKELRPRIEKLLTRGKAATLANRRLIAAQVGAEAAGKLIKVAEQHKERAGGYTRITKMGERKGDAARMAVIEFVSSSHS